MRFVPIWSKIQSKNLFLVDSLGALLSAVLLVLILARFENTFGVPHSMIHILAVIPCIFAIYSCLFFLIKIKDWKRYMKVIAIANLMYCCLTAGLIIYFYDKLTILGLIYFALEIIVVSILAYIELKTASN